MKELPKLLGTAVTDRLLLILLPSGKQRRGASKFRARLDPGAKSHKSRQHGCSCFARRRETCPVGWRRSPPAGGAARANESLLAHQACRLGLGGASTIVLETEGQPVVTDGEAEREQRC
jgi:hypothetical protein